MFEDVPLAPSDPILGLTEAFKKDPNPAKINLGVGVFTDSNGKTPLLNCAREAEKRLAGSAVSRVYLPIEGDPIYRAQMQSLILGADSEALFTKRVFTACAPGGTGALRVVADFLKQNFPSIKVWISNPTWPNHTQIFDAAGVRTERYAWFDPIGNCLDFGGLVSTLEKVPSGNAVLLHGCCHNPTGIDPTLEQWTQIAEILAARNILPIVDFAYQGFGTGIEEDAAGLRVLASRCRNMIVCSSCSKNFSLYADRVGAVSFLCDDESMAQRIGSQVKRVIRANYSNPPQHGFSVVASIMGDKDLRTMWVDEVRLMRERINGLRALFADTLAGKGIKQDFGFIKRQLGMFSFSGLSKEQVDELREKHSIYIVASGRVSVAGMNEKTMDRLCDAIASVLR
ncbi:MAG: aspartate/tyrosine/aromatic aminotransferase [Opitutales bacterium]|nr:aspartate/tyrosine/aromatic aminotransferase [Opitutales bacterium]